MSLRNHLLIETRIGKIIGVRINTIEIVQEITEDKIKARDMTADMILIGNVTMIGTIVKIPTEMAIGTVQRKKEAIIEMKSSLNLRISHKEAKKKSKTREFNRMIAMPSTKD